MRGPVKRKVFYKGRDREKEILRILQQTFSLRVRRKEKCISELKKKLCCHLINWLKKTDNRCEDSALSPTCTRRKTVVANIAK